MSMPKAVIAEIQWRLAEYLPIDSPSPDYVANGLIKFDEVGAQKQWQWAVDLIYRLLVCDLIRLWPDGYLSKAGKLTFNGPLDFCQALAQQNPYSFEETSQLPVPWIGPSIGMTDRLRELLKKHDMVWTKREDAWPLNEAFIADIESIFEAHDVGWTDEPLIPIRDDSAKA